MATRKRKSRMYQVIDKYRGKVRLQTGEGETLLDENTPQEVLAQLYNGGQSFIELVPAASAVVAEPTK